MTEPGGRSIESEREIPLWPEGAPGAPGLLGSRPEDVPTLTWYPADPAKATGAGVVVFPGGGYRTLAPHEGVGYARWLAANGLHAFVVKYRLGSEGHRHPAMLQDGARAMRLVRAKAAEWGVDPERLGVMGSSAGGHLASTVLTHFDGGDPSHPDPVERESSRPDLGILCYPVISLGAEHGHAGSRENLLGENPTPELVGLLSNQKQVTADTPPCFLWHTWEDATVNVENSILFASALRQNGVRFELHIYEKGGHGLGLGGEARHRWSGNCLAWLAERGWISDFE